MALTLATLREDLLDQLGLLSIDEMVPEASLNRSVNAGLRRMSREFDWPWLQEFTTIAITEDDDEYALPAGFVRVIAASIEGQELSAITARDMIRDFDTHGAPDSFYVRGGNIKLAPIPNVANTPNLVYIRPENTLTDDSDTILAPDSYRDIIVVYAAIHQATRLKDQQLLSTLEMIRKQNLENIKRDTLRTTRVPRIRVRDDV